MPVLQPIRAGTVKRIHVDKRVIATNRRTGGREPAIKIQTSKGSLPARTVYVLGPSRMISDAPPLKCGARVWLETYAAVEYVP